MAARLGRDWYSGRIEPKEDFWLTLPVLSQAKDIDFEVACYISSFPPQWYKHRIDWLCKHGFPSAPLIATEQKIEACIKLGITHLVDDRPETIKALQKHTNTQGIHFITPYCGFEPVGDKVIRSLKEVTKFVEI